MQSVLPARQWWASYRIVCGNLFVFFWKQKTVGEYFGEKRSWHLRGEKRNTQYSDFFFFPSQTSNLQCLGSILLSAIFFPLLFLQENFNMDFFITCEAQKLPWFTPACTVPVPCPSGTAPLCVVPWIRCWVMSFCRGCSTGWWEWVGFGWLLPANTEPSAGTAMEFPSEVSGVVNCTLI